VQVGSQFFELGLELGEASPAVRSAMADQLQFAYCISKGQAFQATAFARQSQRYPPCSNPQVALQMRLMELAAARVR
jgi:hypothetical protein